MSVNLGVAQPTLLEVAARAQVSRATVSRVVNGSPRVSPEAKAAVDEAIEALGYIPNHAARTLVTRRTNTIALLVSEPQSRVFSDPFFASMARGVSTALSATQFQLVLLLATNGPEHDNIARYVQQRLVDGVLLMSLHGPDPLPGVLQRAGVPTVLNGRPTDLSDVPYVDADNRGGARAATSHLIANGRTRIVTAAGPQDMPAGIDRYTGYRDALSAAGLRPRRKDAAIGDFTEASGAGAIRKLLDTVPDLDAVFAGSDAMAVGVMRELQAAGRKVPDDVAVVGFDDAPYAEHTSPPLTTVRQPLEEMARRMCELLVAQIEGNPADEQQVVLPTELIVRESA
jgi:DNA-binding LacI/PurR family transcriptional regulator